MLNFYHVLTLIKGVIGVLEALRKARITLNSLEKFLRTAKNEKLSWREMTQRARVALKRWKTDLPARQQWLPGAGARSLLQEVSGYVTSLNSSVDI